MAMKVKKSPLSKTKPVALKSASSKKTSKVKPAVATTLTKKNNSNVRSSSSSKKQQHQHQHQNQRLVTAANVSKSSLTRRIVSNLSCVVPPVRAKLEMAQDTNIVRPNVHFPLHNNNNNNNEDDNEDCNMKNNEKRKATTDTTMNATSTDASVTSAALVFPNRAVWYLGGNQLAKLLTSVDGDLDHVVLSKIAQVPAQIGDLALSVECLVSDDATTVGGFEGDILAQIANNTLACLTTTTTPPTTIRDPTVSSNHNANTTATCTVSTTLLPTQDPIVANVVETATSAETANVNTASSLSVPNPLSALNNYPPIPDPLARITPPGSPKSEL